MHESLSPQVSQARRHHSVPSQLARRTADAFGCEPTQPKDEGGHGPESDDDGPARLTHVDDSTNMLSRAPTASRTSLAPRLSAHLESLASSR